MGKRQGSPLNQDMDFNNDSPARGQGNGPRKAPPEVLARRKKVRARRGNRARKKPTAPKIVLAAPAQSGSNEDAFAAFGKLGNSNTDTTANTSGNDSASSGSDFSAAASSWAGSGDAISIFGGAPPAGAAASGAKVAAKQPRSASKLSRTQQALRRLNKTFKDHILQNWEQHRSDDWTIQMMEYIDFAKKIVKENEDSDANEIAALGRPSLNRNLTPHPSKGIGGPASGSISKDNSKDDDSDDGEPGKRSKKVRSGDDDGDAGASSNMFGTASSDVFGSSSSSDAPDTSNLFGGASGGDADSTSASSIFGTPADGDSAGSSTAASIFGNSSGGDSGDSGSSSIFGSSAADSGDGGASIFGTSSGGDDNADSSNIFGTGGNIFDLPSTSSALWGGDAAPAAAPEPAPAPAPVEKAKAKKIDIEHAQHQLRCALHKFKDETDDNGKVRTNVANIFALVPISAI